MSYLLSALLVAATALVWLLFVTLAPDSADWAPVLRDAASFLTALSVARFVEVLVSTLVDDSDGNSRTTDLVKVMSSIVIYIAAMLVWLHYGMAFDITSLLATSAIVSLVLGFALQNTLGNLFSGLSLELERPLRVGDFIRKGTVEGEVVALKWRSIFLRTPNGSSIVLPNSTLATDAVEVVRRGQSVRTAVSFLVPDRIPPMRVFKVAEEVLDRGVPGVAEDPLSSVVLIGPEPETGTMRYALRCYTTKPIDTTSLASRVLTALWYAFDRQDIPMTGESRDAIAPALPQSPAFLGNLAGLGRLLRFGPGETVPPQLAGFVVDGGLHEEVLSHEIDLDAELAPILGAVFGPNRLPLIPPTAIRHIARQAALFLGPVAFTLADHYGSLTTDPYLLYHALASRIPDALDRQRFLSNAPDRPLRHISPGDAFGWASRLQVETIATRKRTVVYSADLLVLDEAAAAILADHPEGEALRARILASSPLLEALGPELLAVRLAKNSGEPVES
ncbi:mechanosensitive ion channel [Rhizobium sp. CG5]|uniref:mechanosensitive ion channel family protein n=1 Tax=Rhizobium sp. CG5 TaxID=2726076 RepID=UPI0020333712|nr:mechanosensitive ion channel domain-containing protein [Rhizobium sp. CG5]MCM2473749.1 mechanosensitive ion channel [Rhizobium sp. CG5]